ncbi:MAG: EthD family reductase [Actinomycetota bacterium]|nr:EthD family reductase [Actinomycetota bacterium]
MARFVALYERPDDVDGFEEHYRTTHLPLAQAWPGVRETRVTRFTGTPRGSAPAYYLQFEAEFDSDEEMAAALRSDAGMAAAKDAMAMAQRFGVTPVMLLGGEFSAGGAAG